MNVAQKYLRKNCIREMDQQSEQYSEVDQADMISVASRRDDILADFLTRDPRGGDLSPYRKFKSQLRQRRESEMDPTLNKHDKSAPPNLWGTFKHKKSEMVPTQLKMDMSGDPHGGKTMKAAKSSLPENVPRKISGMGGFSSYVSNDPPQEPVRELHGDEEKKFVSFVSFMYLGQALSQR